MKSSAMTRRPSARLDKGAHDGDTISRARRLLGASLAVALTSAILIVLRYWSIGPPIAWLWFLTLATSGLTSMIAIVPTDRISIRVVLCEFGFLFLLGSGVYVTSQVVKFLISFGLRNPSTCAYCCMDCAIVVLIALWTQMLLPKRDAPSLCSALAIGSTNLRDADFYHAPSCRVPLMWVLFYICWLPTRLLLATRLEASGVWYRMSAEDALSRVWTVIRFGALALAGFCWGLVILEWVRWTFIERPADVQIGLSMFGTVAIFVTFFVPGLRRKIQRYFEPPKVHPSNTQVVNVTQ